MIHFIYVEVDLGLDWYKVNDAVGRARNTRKISKSEGDKQPDKLNENMGMIK